MTQIVWLIIEQQKEYPISDTIDNMKWWHLMCNENRLIVTILASHVIWGKDYYKKQKVVMMYIYHKYLCHNHNHHDLLSLFEENYNHRILCHDNKQIPRSIFDFGKIFCHHQFLAMVNCMVQFIELRVKLDWSY